MRTAALHRIFKGTKGLHPEGTASDRVPCDVCCRFHRGPRCKPEDQRSVQMCITFPGRIHRLLTERVPWGERSGFVARAVAKELDQ
jgi:hypothetical protein